MDVTPGGKDALAAPPPPHNHAESLLHMFDGIRVLFPRYKHDHPPVVNVNKVADEEMTVGQKVADGVASGIGSWKFIIIQACIMACWVTLNSVAWFFHYDGYPYILLNLAMSAEAAFTAPLIMMSQNRQAEKDRLTAQNDYLTDCKGEEEVRNIMEHLDHQDTVILQILQRMEAQHKEVLSHLSQLDPELARKLGVDIQQLSEEAIEASGKSGGNS